MHLAEPTYQGCRQENFPEKSTSNQRLDWGEFAGWCVRAYSVGNPHEEKNTGGLSDRLINIKTHETTNINHQSAGNPVASSQLPLTGHAPAMPLSG